MIKVTVEVEAPDAPAAFQQLRTFLESSDGGTVTGAPAVAHSAQDGQQSEQNDQSEPPGDAEPRVSDAVKKLAADNAVDLATVTGTGKHGRITKKDVEAVIANNSDPSQPGDTDSDDAPTKQDCINALEKVNDVKGINACIELLRSFGATRIGDMNEDQYADFIQRCQEMVPA